MSDATLNLNIAFPYAWVDDREETAGDPPEKCTWCRSPIWPGEAMHPCVFHVSL